MTNKYLLKTSLYFCLMIFISSILTVAVYAVPACPFPVEKVQSDGTPVTVVTKGDEFFNWTEDENGYVIAYDSDSENWCYAYIDSQNDIQPGPEVLGKQFLFAFGTSNQRSMLNEPRITVQDLYPIIENTDRSYSEKVIPDISSPMSQMNIISSISAFTAMNDTKVSDVKTQKMLLILIEYNDTPLQNTIDFWYEKYFDSGSKSVSSYYTEVSGGKYKLEPVKFKSDTPADTVYGKSGGTFAEIEIKNNIARVKLNKKHPTYQGGEKGYDAAKADIDKAYKAIEDYLDFSEIELYKGYYILREDIQISAVIAGFEAAVGYSSSGNKSTWGHLMEEKLRDGTVISVADGEVYSYIVHGEMMSDDIPTGIGVAVHEIGHSLGLPDLYDTTEKSYGVGAYTAMAIGMWGYTKGDGAQYSGYTPAHLDAWSKIQLGFVTPQTVTSTEYAKIAVNGIDLNNPNTYNVLKVISDADPNQYFLVENRQLTGFDSGLYTWLGASNTGGILIYHIDESVIKVSSNINDNYMHKGIDVEEAQGHTLDIAPDNYPYGSNHFFGRGMMSILSGITTPSSHFYKLISSAAHNDSGAVDCHPQTLASGIRIEVLDPIKPSMNVQVGIDISISNTEMEYNGNHQEVTVATFPEADTVTVLYDGSPTPPSAVGTYSVLVTAKIDGCTVTKTADFTIISNQHTDNRVDEASEITVLISVEPKEYNGTDCAVVTLSSANIAESDLSDVTFNYTSAVFSDKDAGENKTVTVSGITLSGAKANKYTVSGTAEGSGTISKKTLTFTASVSDKIYNGTTTADVSDIHFIGLENDDTLSLTPDYTVSGVFADSSAGSNKAVTVTVTLNDTVNSNNYTLGSFNTCTAYAAILPLTIEGITATGYNGSYDGDCHDGIVINGTESEDIIEYKTSEDGIYSPSIPQFKDSGTYTIYYKVCRENSEDYTNSVTVSISKSQIFISYASVDTKVYDGTASASVLMHTLGGISGLGLTENIDYTLTASFSDANAGTGKSIVIAISLNNTEATANYALAEDSSYTIATADIIPLEVVITPNANQSKTVGDVDRVLTYTGFPQLIGSDDFDGCLSRDFGEDSGLDYQITLGTLSAGNNYTLRLDVHPVYFSIAQKSIIDLTISDIADVTYNGAAFTPAPQVKDGDKVLVNGIDYMLTYSNNIGAGTGTVTITGKGNYNGSTYTEFTINPALISVSGADVSNKTYNSNTNATVTAVTFDGLVEGETLLLLLGTDYMAEAQFSDANAGEGKSVSVTIIPQTSEITANYIFNSNSISTTADITPLEVTITPDENQSKTVGEADPVLTYTAFPQLIGSDTFDGTLSRDFGESGEASYHITLGTLSAGNNYVLKLNSSPVYFFIKNKIPASVEVEAAGTAKDRVNPANGMDELLRSLFVSEDELESGDKIEFVLTVNEASEDNLTESEKTLLKNSFGGNEIALFLDISLDKYVENSFDRSIESLGNNKITLVIDIPEEIRNPEHNFSVIHIRRDGTAEILPDLDDDDATVTIEVGSFSPFIMVYKMKDQPVTEKENNDTMIYWMLINQIFADKKETPKVSVDTDITYTETVTDPMPTSCCYEKFTDLGDEYEIYHDTIDYVVSNGWFKGVSSSEFNPSGTMNRAMIPTVLARIAEVNTEPVDECVFTDVDLVKFSWASAAIKWGYECGIVKGTDTDKFSPEAEVTIEQAVTFIYRYIKILDIDVSVASPVDMSEYGVSEYAYESMAWAFANSMINETELADADKPASRILFADMLYAISDIFY